MINETKELPASDLRGDVERQAASAKRGENRLNDIELAIIGGIGIYDAGLLKYSQQIKMHTPYGMPSDLITVGTYNGIKIAFLPRHGSHHTYPPHRIPYRANLWALKELGVKRIIAASAVGSLKEEIQPGHIVILDDFFDARKKCDYTFYDGGEACHLSMSEPFCPELREIAYQTGMEKGVTTHKKGTVVVIEGPRYSTKTEDRFYRTVVNADVINQTIVPECILALELQMCYVCIAAVSNYDIWREEMMDASLIKTTMRQTLKSVRDIMVNMLVKIPKERNKCHCGQSLENAII